MPSVELLAFAEVSDDVLVIRKQLELVFVHIIPLHMLIDFKCVFNVIYKGSCTSEDRTMSDIYALRKSYKMQEIENIGFVKASYNLANGLPKPKM